MPTVSNYSKALVRSHELKPIVSEGMWVSNDRLYRDYAHAQLGELIVLCAQLNEIWPTPGKAIKVEDASSELIALIRQRDRLSDSTRIFCAMATEGFINFYGVLRIGEDCFYENFERLGLIPKVRAVLLFCDKLVIDRTAPILHVMGKIAEDRNRLVHPKVKEVNLSNIEREKWSELIPDAAKEAVQNMEVFFSEFLSIVPGARFHISHPYSAE